MKKRNLKEAGAFNPRIFTAFILGSGCLDGGAQFCGNAALWDSHRFVWPAGILLLQTAGFILAAFAHLEDGLIVIVDDYVHEEGGRLI